MNPVPILRLRSLVRNFIAAVESEPRTDAEIEGAYRDISRFVDETVADLPSMTDDQRDRLDAANARSSALMVEHIACLKEIVSVIDELAVRALKEMGGGYDA